MISQMLLGLSSSINLFISSSGYSLQVRHKANAQIFTGLSASIPQPLSKGTLFNTSPPQPVFLKNGFCLLQWKIFICR
jgi:hypothetical protein